MILTSKEAIQEFEEMTKIPQIIKVESTQSNVKITLDNGVVLDVYSNHDYLHFSLSGVNLPLKIGCCSSFIGEVNNCFECKYEPVN